jgi:hypothetical protein
MDARGKLGQRAAWLAALTMVAAAVGCAAPKSYFARPDKEKAPTGEVCEILPIFQHTVCYSQDPVHNGQKIPCLAGTVYLLSRGSPYPVECNGTMVLELYDDSNPQESVRKENWEINKDILKTRLVYGNDPTSFGWGYNLILPWASYNPQMTRVHLHIAVKGDKSTLPVFMDSESFALGDVPDLKSTSKSTVLGQAGRTTVIPADGTSPQQGGIVQANALEVRRTDIPLGPHGLQTSVSVGNLPGPLTTTVSYQPMPQNSKPAPPTPVTVDAPPGDAPPAQVQSNGTHTLTVPGGNVSQPVQIWPPPPASR